MDVRLGLQKVAWGKLDRSQPNDLINPSNYIDPLMDDEAERKIGVPALQASYYFPESWLPVGRPPDCGVGAAVHSLPLPAG